MPNERPLTPEEAEWYKSQGLNPDDYKAQLPDAPKEDIGVGQTVGRTLLAHGGGILGGGASALGGTALAAALAPESMGASLLIPAITALAGGYAGQKTQDTLQGDDITQRLQLEQQVAAEQNPKTALATDIGASMLAGGGRPSLSILPRAIGGDVNAMRTIGVNSLINPAINTGLNYAATGQLPSLGELGAQAASGLVTDNAKWASKITGHGQVESDNQATAPEPDNTTGEQQGPTSPYNHIQPDGTPLIDDTNVKKAFKDQINPKPDYDKLTSPEDIYAARTQYERANKMPVDDMRQSLHDKWMQGKISTPDLPTVKIPEQPNVPKVEDNTIPAVQGDEQSKPSIQELDFQKAKEEKYKQDVEDYKNGITDTEPVAPKPITANQARIINPDTLLTSDINRPESFDRNKYAPISDKEQYDSLLSKAKTMMASGDSNSKEFRDLWQQIEDVKNKNSGQVPSNLPDVIEKHLETEKNPTVGSTLQQVASTKSEWQDLANHILNHASPEKLTTPINIDTDEGRSHYDPSNKKINLALSDMNNPNTVMHEIAHAVTSNNLPTEFEGLRGESLKSAMDKYSANPDSNPHVKELIQSYYQAAKELGVYDKLFNDKGMGKGEKAPYVRGLSGAPDEAARQLPAHGYAMGDLHEFVDGVITNKDFQKTLNGMSSGRNDGQSLWSRIVESIRNLIGVPVKEKSLLERALHASDEIIKSHRYSESTSENKKFAPLESKDNEEPTRKVGWLRNLTRSMVDKISDINHPGAKTVSDAVKRTLNEIPQRFGVTGNRVVEAGQKLTSEDKVQIKKIFDYENLHKKAAPNEMFTNDRQRNFYKVERQVYKESGQYRIANNEPVLENGKPRQLIQKEFAHPTTPNQQVAEVYKTNTDTTRIAQLDKEFLDNLSKHGYSAKEAKEGLQNFKESLQGDLRNTASNMQYYNAARKAQGIPLPDSFTRADPVKNLEAYYHRQAIDNSFYKNIESNHDVLGVLGAGKDAWNNPVKQHPQGSIANNTAVKNALAEFHGQSGGPGFHNERAISSLATTLFISNPALEVHKLASNILGITNYADNPVQLGRILGSMIKNFGEGIAHAKENGVLKLSAKSVGDAFDSTATAAERMQALASGVRKISSLGGLSDKLSSGLMQAGAETVLPQKIEKANSGDRTSQDLLKKLDPDWEKGKQYTPDEVTKLASTLSSYIHGTGDGRTMPAWMAGDTELSGFFKLAHWSIAQTNRFFSDVYDPATKGNLTPLLTSLFGSAIGGYLIKDLREKIQGKHGQIPSLDEISSSEGGLAGHKALVGYNMVAAAQYAGFGGLLSQFAKYPFDIAYKNNPQGATFPLDEIGTDMAKTLEQVSGAIANDKNINWFELASHIAGHVMTTDIQLSKVALNQAINNGMVTGTVAEKKDLGDKLGKLRRFEEIQGLPYQDQGPDANNPYMDLDTKKFRTTQDIGEAAKMLPQLVNNIMTQYKSQPDVMMDKLKSLKEHSYNTMPSMESMPLEYLKYVGYLQREEGPEKAKEAVLDYMKHRVIGEAKASVVP